MAQRRRLSRGSGDEHTWHWQPITGIPCDVPVLRNVTSTRIARSSWHSPPMSATLTSLRIRNLALVEELTWEPQAGFVAITGETGAGKSIILGAMNLVLGERSDKNAVRTGADACASRPFSRTSTMSGSVYFLPATAPKVAKRAPSPEASAAGSGSEQAVCKWFTLHPGLASLLGKSVG